MKTLIRNGSVVTMDPKLKEFEGDVLIQDDRILAAGPRLEANGAQVIDASGMVVMPGLVNSHIHTWELSLRGIGADWISARDYFANIHGNLAQRFEAEDNYVANLLGALAQLNAGTTTIFDWCHNLRSSEMTDASLDGIVESGIRAVFGHGTAKPMGVKQAKPYYEIPQPREEIRRLRTGRLASDDGLVTLALAILGPDYGTYEVAEADIRLSREFGILNSAHTAGRQGKRMVPDGYWRLAKAGLLGPDHNIVHGNCLPDDELKMIVEAGCSVSATCMAELLNWDQPPLVGRLERLGATPAIGTDVDPYFAASMWQEMRRAFLHQREMDNRALSAQGRWPAESHATTVRTALRWATLGGAKALRLEDRIGSITPGKQADVILVRSDDLNIFPSVPLGDPVQAVVMNAETANVDTVLVAGKVVKRHGKLAFPAARIEKLKAEVLASRERVMKKGNYVYRPVEEGPRP
ncbi:MAG TPA: amidohydrolase family protein [Burkholderiales bacterium]|nr:amidohydrolase family protein [Burkholderiales bacterium]